MKNVIIKNKGQTLVVWAIGLAFVLIGGIGTNQYKLTQDNAETKTEIKQILKEVKEINEKWDKIIDIKIKPSVIQNNNVKKLNNNNNE